MDAALPIRPGAPSFIMALTPTASPATRSPMLASQGDVVYLFDATGLPSGSRAWIGYGMTSTAAQANASAPLIGTPSSALPLAAGTVQGFTLTGGIFLAGIMEQGSGVVACMIGFGV